MQAEERNRQPLVGASFTPNGDRENARENGEIGEDLDRGNV